MLGLVGIEVPSYREFEPKLRVRGKGRDGDKLRKLPLTRLELRAALATWLEQRHTRPGADQPPALLLNRSGARLSDRTARTIITALGE